MNAAIARKLFALAAVAVATGTLFAPTAEAGIVFTTSCSALPLMSTSRATRIDPVCAGICMNQTCGKVNVDCFDACTDTEGQPEGVCYNHGAPCEGETPFVCGPAICAVSAEECGIVITQMGRGNIDAYSLPGCGAL